METSRDPRGEHPSTYIVQDRSNRDELTRLLVQDHLLTQGMNGVLAEQLRPETFSHVLDVACGPGTWLIEVAQTYPTISQLSGVDVNRQFVEYARAQAKEKQLEDRVEFQVMDALRMLEFPDRWFDLVNQRMGFSFLRTWDWSKLLQEYKRICKPDGIVRITESAITIETNSPALFRLNEIVLQAFAQAGHIFTPEPDGVTRYLPPLFKQYGFGDIQTQTYSIDCRPGTPQGEYFLEDAKQASRTLLPFLQKWGHVPEDYPQLCQQILVEMQQPDFRATLPLTTIWGTR